MSRLFQNGFQSLARVSEWILVKRAKSGEKEAFGKLYERYLDALYRYIFFRVGYNRELSEDLVQSVFVKAWEKLDTFHTGSFKAWLYTIARNSLIDYFRSHKETTSIDDTHEDINSAVEEVIHTKLEIEKVKNALQYLTQEQRELIVFKFIEDMSNKEIADILGKNEDAIRAMQYRALKELRVILGRSITTTPESGKDPGQARMTK